MINKVESMILQIKWNLTLGITTKYFTQGQRLLVMQQIEITG
jgi:hypothetical protein